MKKNYALPFKTVVFLVVFIAAGTLAAQSAFTGKPRYQIEARRLGSTIGYINIELFPNIAPYHARNFDSLVSTKFYDTTAFHRVIPGFVIQGGDPNSRHGPTSTWGQGQLGQPTVKAEFSVAKHERGILSAARLSNNINSATSQFFICVAPASNLNGQYSVYGRVTSGMAVVDTIVNAPRNLTTNMPFNKIEMFVTYIGSNDTVPQPAVLVAPPTNTVGTDTVLTVLKWNKVSDAQFYYLHVSTNSLFTDTVKGLNTVALTNNMLYLPASSTYYWKVRSNNGGHWSDSQTWNFTTASPDPGVFVGLKGQKGAEPVVVFPNPGADKFVFNNLNKDDLIEITDIRGRLIHQSVVVNKEEIVDLGNQEKGTYLYRISRQNIEVQTGKIVVQ